MATKARLAFFVGRQNTGIGHRLGLGQPAHQGWPHIETHPGIVVDDMLDAPLLVEDARRRIGCVAFRRNPGIPIVVGRSAWLQINRIEPRVFTGGLIKVPMHTDKSCHDCILW